MSRRWFSGGFAGVVGLDKHRTGKTRLFSFGRFALITQVGPWLDGVFCDSQAIAEVAMERVPHLKEGRAIHLPVPIQTFPEFLSRHRAPMAHRPIRLGFVGRVDHEQKRVERFIVEIKASGER